MWNAQALDSRTAAKQQHANGGVVMLPAARRGATATGCGRGCGGMLGAGSAQLKLLGGAVRGSSGARFGVVAAVTGNSSANLPGWLSALMVALALPSSSPIRVCPSRSGAGNGQTLGKRWLGLRVLSTSGGPVSRQMRVGVRGW